jgi:hypothetical protein
MKRRTACGAILALTAMGCSGSSPSPITGSPGEDGGSRPSDAAIDHAVGDDGPGGGGPDSGSENGNDGGTESAAPLPFFGKVQFFRIVQTGNVAYEVLGQIQPTGTWWSALLCPPGADASGSCCYIPPLDAGSHPFVSVSAGAMTLALGGTMFGTLAYDTSAMEYAPFNATNPPSMTSWNGGDVLQVSAAGATVPAFSGSVVMPDPLQGLSVSPVMSPTISQSKDWPVTWTPAPGTTKVNVLLYGGGEIKCVVDAAAGAVTLPAAFIGRLTAAGGSSVFVESVTIAPVSTANATIEIAAFNQVFNTVILQP